MERLWERRRSVLLLGLRGRALFKTVEIFRHASEAQAVSPESALEITQDIAHKAQLDPEFYVGLDVAVDVPYSDDASLRVLFPRGPARLPSEVSFLLERLRNETITRTRIIFAPEIREAVQGALLT